MVPREGGCGRHRAPRGRERLHRGAHRAPRGPARADLRRDQGTHARDRPVGADAPRRLVVLRPHGRGQAVRHPVPRTARLRRTTGRRPSSRPTSTVPGEQILLDGNVEAEGHEFFSLGSFEVSNDGTRMLYGVDVAGDERYTVRVRDLVTGEQLPDEIPGTFAGATFSPDGRFIVYTTVDDAWRPDTVWLHELGTPVDRRREALPRARRAVLGRRGLHPQRPLPRDRDRLVDHARGMARGCRRPALRAARRVAAHRGRRVRLLARRDRRRGRAVHPPQRRRPGFRAGAGGGIRPLRSAADRRSRTVPASGCSACRRSATGACVGYRRGGLARARHARLRRRLGRRRSSSTSRCTRSATGGNPEWAPPLIRARLRLVRDARHGVRLRGRDRRPAAAQAPAGARRLRARATTRRRGCGRPRRTARRSRSRSCGSARSATPAPRRAPLHLYGYGSYEHSIEPGFSVRAPVGARPRRDLRRRARARRRRDGPPVVRGRQAAAASATRSPTSSTAPCTSIDHGYTTRRPAGRRGRLGRRPADGRRREPRARSCSPASSPTCRSSTRSRRSSTRRCRSR